MEREDDEIDEKEESEGMDFGASRRMRERERGVER